MGLGGGEQSLGHVHSAGGTYCWILATCILTGLQCVTMSVGSDGVDIQNIVMDVGNYIWTIAMNVRNNDVGVRNVMTDISLPIYPKFRLEAKG